MQRTGILALGAALLAVLLVPQANAAAISVGHGQHAAQSEVHAVTFDKLHQKHKAKKHKHKHKKHKKHKKHTKPHHH